jgi:hypothetical protein
MAVSFRESDKTKMLLWCDRHCCLCDKSCGIDIEFAHIHDKATGGENTLDNAIPVCYDCHSKIGHYRKEHPKGNKFNKNELKTRREQIFEKYTRHLIPPLIHKISQASDLQQYRDVRFSLINQGNSLPVKALVALEIFVGQQSKGFASTENGLYCGNTFWNLNPLQGVEGHFPLSEEIVNTDKSLEIKVNVKILDIFEREHHLLPVGWVYDRKNNSWFFEPGETLYGGERKYQLKDWGKFGIL